MVAFPSLRIREETTATTVGFEKTLSENKSTKVNHTGQNFGKAELAPQGPTGGQTGEIRMKMEARAREPCGCLSVRQHDTSDWYPAALGWFKSLQGKLRLPGRVCLKGE